MLTFLLYADAINDSRLFDVATSYIENIPYLKVTLQKKYEKKHITNRYRVLQQQEHEITHLTISVCEINFSFDGPIVNRTHCNDKCDILTTNLT